MGTSDRPRLSKQACAFRHVCHFPVIPCPRQIPDVCKSSAEVVEFDKDQTSVSWLELLGSFVRELDAQLETACPRFFSMIFGLFSTMTNFGEEN